jgi:hypothetical protein
MLPLRSTVEDVKRLTLFQLSTNGLLFLAKQQVLQLGNTFESTRLINPAFVVANAVPFLHIKRNLRPANELIGKTDRSYQSVRTMGQLQMSTYNALKSKSIPLLGEDPTAPPGASSTLGKIGGALKGRLLGPLKSVVDTAKSAVSAVSPLQKRNVGQLGGNWNAESWKVSRPELSKYIPDIQKRLYEQQQSYADETVSEVVKPNNKTSAVSSLGKRALGSVFNLGGVKLPKSLTDNVQLGTSTQNPQLGTSVSTKSVSFIKYFDASDSLSKAVWSDNDTPQTAKAKRSGDGQLSEPTDAKKRISYIKDPSNLPPKQVNTEVKNIPYRAINSSFEDPIVVSFAMGDDTSPIRFRAYIRDLQQTATPEYKPYQYIGRMEKFINYVGVQREISFKLGIIAFGADELDGVWRRINYLTGLVFPYGFSRGILQPNIVRLTIGNVYTNQPGYVTALNTNFNEISESWDIDRQVPISAVMDMKFTLIEKATRIASSPFYGMTEQDTDNFSTIIKEESIPKSSTPQPAETTTTERRAPQLGPIKIPAFKPNFGTVKTAAAGFASGLGIGRRTP